LDGLHLDIADDDLDTLLEVAARLSGDDPAVKTLAESVYVKCVSDRDFAKTGAFLCDKIAALEQIGNSFFLFLNLFV